MQEFKIRPDGFKEIRKSMLMRAIPGLLIAVLGGVAISYFNSTNHQTDINTLPFTIPLILGALAFGIHLGIKKQEKIYDTYVLTIDDYEITREQENTPTIIISIDAITEIFKTAKGDFKIKGDSNLNAIVVPAQIANYELLEKSLSNIKAFSSKTSESFLKKYNRILSLATIGLMALVYISTNKIVVGLSGVALLSLLGYSFSEVQRSKNIDNTTKNNIWAILLVAISILGVMYFKIIGIG